MAINFPTSPTTNDIWTENDRSWKFNGTSWDGLPTPSVAGNVAYTPAGTGAVDTTVETKLRESVSVKDFGAVGDGDTDDTAAIQAAVDHVTLSQRGTIIFPAGAYRIRNLQLKESDYILDFQGSLIIVDDADCILFHSSTAHDQQWTTIIENAHFLVNGDFRCIVAHQIWDASYKQPHEIRNCEFAIQMNYTGSVSSIISLQGIGALTCHDCTFRGTYADNDAYAIKSITTDDTDTHVMNINVSDCYFVNIEYPVYQSDRTLVAGGRSEGWSVVDCSILAAKIGFRSFMSLSDRFHGNLVSQVYTGVEFTSHHSTISCNSMESIYTTGIHIKTNASTIVEGLVCNGNVIKQSTDVSKITSDTCAVLVDLVGNEKFRNSSFSNNVFDDSTGDKTRSAVVFNGNFIAQNLDFSNQVAMYYDHVFSSDATTGNVIRGTFNPCHRYLTNNIFNDFLPFEEKGNHAEIRRTKRGTLGATPDVTEHDVVMANSGDTVDITGFISSSDDGKTVTYINESGSSKTIINSSTFKLRGNIDKTLGFRETFTMQYFDTIWYEIS